MVPHVLLPSRRGRRRQPPGVQHGSHLLCKGVLLAEVCGEGGRLRKSRGAEATGERFGDVWQVRVMLLHMPCQFAGQSKTLAAVATPVGLDPSVNRQVLL